MRLKLFSLATALFLGLTCLATGRAQSAERTVWRIGVFDGSSGEFADGVPHQAVNFVIGKDQPRASWFGYAPVAFPSKVVDQAAAPRDVSFSIPSEPGRAYRLRVSLLIEQSSVPALRVGINGRAGLFYLHPKLDYNMGDTVAAFYPAYARAEVEADFPGSWLKKGENTISFQAAAVSDKGVPDAGFEYDAIELLNADAMGPEVTAHVEPTIFFQKKDSSAEERVDVFVRFQEQPHSGRVELRLAGHTFTQPLGGSRDFGEERVSFNVPEFSAGTSARVTVDADGHKHQFEETIDPQKKWTIFLVPHVHLDVGYTDYQAKVSAIQSRILDEAIDLNEKHPDFRFSTDGEWNLEQFLQSRTAEERERMIQAIKDRKIYIPAQSSNVLTGFPTAETLIRSLYPSAEFSRVHGTPFNYANITDVPSYSWSYASVLAAAGVPYFLAGSNNDRAPVLLQGHLNENTPYWWEGPDGGKVLMWYSRHYMQMQFLFGLPPFTQTGEEVLPLFLQMYQRASYHASAAIIFGTQVENTDLFPQQAVLADQWNALYAYPHIEYSGFHDALEKIAGQFGNDIPTVRGDGGPYWEDGIGSDAFYAAIERENESRAPSAEKLATISTLVNPRLAINRGELDSMWANMVLMDEHTWASWNSVSDPDSDEANEQLRVKDSRATAAADLQGDILRSSMAALADSIAVGVDNLIVFNTLNWRRDGEVTIDLDKDMEIADRSTKEAVPYIVLHEGPNFRTVEFRANDVPAVGYKVYELRNARAAAPVPQKTTSTTLESRFYRVELDPESGSIRSLYDKQLNKELVDSESPWRFGQYLYVSGGDEEPNSILQYRAVSPKPLLHTHPAGNGRLVSVSRTPWGWRAELESSAENTPEIHTEIRVFDGEKKIELIENLEKKPELKKEAVYFAFPFAMAHPQFQYEIQNGVVDPAKDMYPGAGHEWFSVQHWVSVQQDGVSATVMPLDASLVTLGDINRGAWPTSFGERPGNIFSYAMNNYWHTNYRAAQGGHFEFRYVITSAAETDAPALSRMAWEETTPMETDQIRSQDKALDLPRPLNGDQTSFLSVEDPNLLLDTWKPAEDGNGTILRFIDLGGQSRTVTVNVPIVSLGKVVATDAVERDQNGIVPESPHSFKIDVRPHQIITVRLVGQ
ncbi:MAG TPA: polysaccharide lyase family protein [Terracidiphilus sp.]|nr:polysaccharide lyase family protein [Terracidiphilus sp.]